MKSEDNILLVNYYLPQFTLSVVPQYAFPLYKFSTKSIKFLPTPGFYPNIIILHNSRVASFCL